LRVEVASPPEDKVSEVLLRETLRPEDETDSDKVTVPLKPLRLVTVMVDELVEDCERLKDVGFALMLKSETMTRIERE
jgi:hypothetical protein